MSAGAVIEVRLDLTGIRAAYREMLEDELKARAEEALTGKRPEAQRAFAAGYYRWIETLLRIEARREALPSLVPPPGVTDGLAVLLRERSEFREKHPPCPHCGMALLAASDTYCWSCRQTWERSSASH
jgi:hypothetical protein